MAGPVPMKDGKSLLESREKFFISQEQVIAAVRSGYARFEWVSLAPGLEVFADAMRIFDVRVPVTAETTAVVADLLNASPTTALIEDWIQERATVKVVPPTFDYRIMQTNAAIFGFSWQVDQQIAGRTGLVACVGKSWILDNAALAARGKAVNYGLFRPDGRYPSITGKFKLWQTPGTAHGPDHWDYSQTLRLCRWSGTGPLPAQPPLKVGELWT